MSDQAVGKGAQKPNAEYISKQIADTRIGYDTTVIINDEGFSTSEQEITYERADTLNRETRALDISADQDLNALSDYLETLTLIRIEFSSLRMVGDLALPVFCA